MDKFDQDVVHYLNHGVLDHTPLICQLRPKESGKGRAFHFLNYLAAHKDFMEIVQGVWQIVHSGDVMEKVWHMLKGVKQKLKQLYVQQFSLYSLVKITVITLVPKVANACQVKDFRRISCSVVYKINAKIHTARLQKVVSYIVSLAQSGFILGRQIMDNVLLATDLIKGYSWSHISPRCMIKLDMAKAYA